MLRLRGRQTSMTFYEYEATLCIASRYRVFRSVR